MKSSINIQVELDEEKMPETIEWNAPGGGVEDNQQAKGVLLSLWDGQEKSALRIDLWTKKMNCAIKFQILKSKFQTPGVTDYHF